MEEARIDSGPGKWIKLRAKKKGHTEGTKRQTESPLCYIDGQVSSEKCGSEPEFQKYNGRVVLRGVIVKDDSGADADSTEQGSSASQMTTAKVMDVIARLPDCDGQAADAISAYRCQIHAPLSHVCQNPKCLQVFPPREWSIPHRNFSPSRRLQAKVFFRVTQTWQAASYRSKTQRKNTSFNTSFDTPWHSPPTQTTPQTHTTRAFPKWSPGSS